MNEYVFLLPFIFIYAIAFFFLPMTGFCFGALLIFLYCKCMAKRYSLNNLSPIKILHLIILLIMVAIVIFKNFNSTLQGTVWQTSLFSDFNLALPILVLPFISYLFTAKYFFNKKLITNKLIVFLLVIAYFISTPSAYYFLGNLPISLLMFVTVIYLVKKSDEKLNRKKIFISSFIGIIAVMAFYVCSEVVLGNSVKDLNLPLGYLIYTSISAIYFIFYAIFLIRFPLYVSHKENQIPTKRLNPILLAIFILLGYLIIRGIGYIYSLTFLDYVSKIAYTDHTSFLMKILPNNISSNALQSISNVLDNILTMFIASSPNASTDNFVFSLFAILLAILGPHLRKKYYFEEKGFITYLIIVLALMMIGTTSASWFEQLKYSIQFTPSMLLAIFINSLPALWCAFFGYAFVKENNETYEQT